MNTVVTVYDLKGALHCSDCGKQVFYNLTAYAPGMIGNIQCRCGVMLKVKRAKLRVAVGPSEVKRARS